MRIKLFILFVTYSLFAAAQFHGIVGSANTNAMCADSNAFIAWGKSCVVSLGYQDISNTALGYVSVGDSSDATGKPGTNGVVSLGDGGYAIVTFSAPISDGPGYDFAVFENSFNDSFLELAFVEVSSDGINYVRFPATCNLPESPQFDNNANMDASKINNLAGKYRANYGTPFDLQELASNSLIDINNITHVKIIDVVGSINPSFDTYDSQNHIINDPWPTPYPSSGFDLDAIGVIHQNAVGINEFEQKNSFIIYPNPATNNFTISNLHGEINQTISVINTLGEVVKLEKTESNQQTIEISNLTSGVYFIQIQNNKGLATIKLIKE